MPVRCGGPVPTGPFAQATPGAGSRPGSPTPCSSTFQCCHGASRLCHNSRAGVPAALLARTPPPARGPWGTLKTGVSGVKPTSSCIGGQRGRGGGVKVHATEAAPLVLVELLKDEVQRQLCAIETGSAATRWGCRSAVPLGERLVFPL